MKNNLKFRAWNGYQFDLNILIDVNGSPCEHGFAGLEAAENIIIDRFTGLKDKRGVEIYENDIIEFSRGFEKERIIKTLVSFVRYDEGKFGFDLIGFNNMFYDLSDDDVKVIGNTHQNPELLK